MNILKSIGAVLAGILFIGVTHSVTDLILEKAGIFTPPEVRFDTTWMVLTALTYRILYSIAGGYLTAKLAPSRPMLHAIVLGLIGLVMSTAAAIVLIPKDYGPAWYPIALAVTAFPVAWLGGWLATRGQR